MVKNVDTSCQPKTIFRISFIILFHSITCKSLKQAWYESMNKQCNTHTHGSNKMFPITHVTFFKMFHHLPSSQNYLEWNHVAYRNPCTSFYILNSMGVPLVCLLVSFLSQPIPHSFKVRYSNVFTGLGAYMYHLPYCVYRYFNHCLSPPLG